MDTIYSLFQKVVKEHENAPAIIENDRAMTFGELSNMVDMITCSFPQEVHSIGIVMRHRTEMIASILAVLKCGGRYVPAEPDFPPGRIHDRGTGGLCADGTRRCAQTERFPHPLYRL